MMDFEDTNAAADSERGETAQASGNAAAPAQARAAAPTAGPTVVLTANAQGAVTLPPGVSLDNLHVEGRNIVIVAADGTRYVIPEGAIIVPQIVADGVAVPPINLAALLVGNEPQPAAGPPRSSGGDFAGDPGDIQAAYNLGNLLPYTELSRPQEQPREIIPALIDRTPSTIIITPNNPAGATSATASVNEAGLPARGNEPPGSNSAANSETTTGTIEFVAQDGLKSLTLNGVAITAVGQTFTTSKGVLTITSMAPGAYGYSYTLSDNTLGDNTSDQFAVQVIDSDGDVATATLTIAIVDDVPTARNDTDTVAAAKYTAETGNVMTGAGTTSGSAGADTQGADGASVSGFRAGTTGNFSAAGTTINGTYGKLTFDAAGNYSYTRNAGTPGGVNDTFSYQLTDGDGDNSTATLVITITDSPATVTSVPTTGGATTVDEAGLPARPGETPGSNQAAPSETASGTVTFTAPDGVGSVQINGTTVTGPGQTITLPTGNFVVTTYDPNAGTLGYSFTLTDNTSGDNTSQVITVTVTDIDGDSDTKPFTITIIDDHPTAVNDANSIAAGQYGPVGGNVLTNDTQGADGAAVTTYTGANGSGGPGTSVAGAYGTLTIAADGTYSYTRSAGTAGGVTDTFSYTIRDGDGDTSTANLVITIADARPSTSANATAQLDDDALAGGNPGGTGDDANAANLTGTLAASGGDGPLTWAFGTNTLPAGFTTDSSTPGTLLIKQGGVTVLTVTLNSATGAYTVAQNAPISHPTGADENNLDFTVGYTVTDKDGDPASGTLTINVDDDTPTASSFSGATFAEGSGAHDIGDAVTLLGISAGADGLQGTLQGIAFTNQGATGGTLSINGAGHLIYTSPNNVTSSTTVTETFSYTITDKDGDPVTRTVTFGVSDTGISNVSATGETVDEDDLQGGIAGGPGDDAPVTTGHISYTLGQDALQSIALSVTSTGLTKLDGTAVSTSWNAATNTLTGYGTTTADVVFTIVLKNIGATGADYDVTLVQPVTHPGHDDPATSPAVETSFEDNKTFTVDVLVKDADNSTGTTSFTVNIDDDSPTASNYTGAAFAEGTGAHDIGDAVTLLGIAAGADGLQGTLQGIAFTNQGASGGTLAINGAGHLVYTSPNNVTSATTVTETFSYTVTDKDGDAVTKTVTFQVTDTGISRVSATDETVDEDDLAGGNAAGPGDDAPVTTGHISYALGQDALQSIALSVTSTGLTRLDGTAVSTSWNAATNTLTGYGTNAADVVFTVVLKNITATGADYDVTLVQPVTHPGHDDPSTAGVTETSFEDNKTFTVDVLVKDADNSTGTTSFTVNIDDDSPVASNYTGATFAEGSGAHDIGVATTLLGISAGADGLQGTLQGITFANQGATTGTVTIDGSGHLIYTSPASASGNLTETFSYTVTDKDGDAVTKTVTFGVSDSGITNPAATSASVDEDDISGANGNAGGPGDLAAQVTTGTISYTKGADAITGITLSTGALGFTKLDGTAITTSFSGGVLTGYGTTPADVVFTITLGALGQASTGYTVNLVQPIKHTVTDDPSTAGTVETAFEDDKSFTVNVVISDSDGSTANTSFSVTIDDDSPVASNYTGATFAEGSGAHDIGVATTLLGISGGADGLSSAPITFTNQGATTGTVTINGSGHLIYTSPASASGNLTETFSYTVTDKDGDAVTKTVTFGVSDTGITNPAATNASVDEDDIAAAGGNAGGPGDLAAQVTTGTISYTKGADAITGITLSTGALGFTKLDGTAITTSFSGGVLTGYGTTPADVVFTITLGALGQASTGYTVNLVQPIKHTVTDDPSTGTVETAFEDDKSFTVNAVISDSDGSTANTSFSVTIDDDSPVASNYTGATFAEGTGAHDIGDAVTLLGISAGADGLSGTLQTIAFTNQGVTGGTVTINGSGHLIYTSPATSTGNFTETFNYTVTDKDGDAVTKTVTFGVSDTGITNPAATSASVDEDNIVGANGIAGGPGDLAVPVPTGTISYTKGADAITGIALSTGAIGFTKLDGTAITTSYNAGTGVLTGYGTSLADVVFTVTLGALGQASTGYTVNLVQPIKHTVTDDPSTAGTVETAFEDDKSFTVNAVITDADGSTANTSFTVTIDDDSPTAAAAVGATLNNAVAATATNYLDADNSVTNNFGADGGKEIFTAATITALQGQALTSGLAPLSYAITNGGQTLTATKTVGAVTTTVFTIDLQPAGHTEQYTITMGAKIDSTQTIDFNGGGYNFVGGNGSWAAFTNAAVGSQDLLLTPINGGTVNTNANEGGIAGGNSVGGTEAMRVDFVIDVTGAPVSGGDFYGGDDTQGFTAHYTANGANALFTSTTNTTVSITARDDADTAPVKNVGDGTLDTITSVGINYNGANLIVTTAGVYSVGGHSFTVAFAAGIATVAGVTDGTRLAGYTANGYNSIEFGHAGGDTFKIGDFGATTISNSPIDFTVPVSLQDGDGDLVSSGNLAIHLNPTTPPVVLDLDGNGVEFSMLADGSGSAGAHDGILVADLDGNGQVSGTGEYAFGSSSLTDLQGVAANYDSNHDGVLDANDADFGKFGVWQDANQNGVSDAGEFHTLAELGITSIGLTTDGQATTTADGTVTVAGIGSFVRDGASYTLADAAFATSSIDRRTAEITATAAAAAAIAVPLAAAAVQVTEPVHQPAPDAVEMPAARGGPGLEIEFDSTAYKHIGPDLLGASEHQAARLPDPAHTEVDAPRSEPAATLQPDHGHVSGPVDSDSVSDGVANFAPAPMESGVAAMDALLAMTANVAALQQVNQAQQYENVREVFADLSGDAMIDKLVNHFVVGDDMPGKVIPGGDFSPAVLFDHVDGHALAVATVVAPMDDAAVALAAAQA